MIEKDKLILYAVLALPKEGLPLLRKTQSLFGKCCHGFMQGQSPSSIPFAAVIDLLPYGKNLQNYYIHRDSTYFRPPLAAIKKVSLLTNALLILSGCLAGGCATCYHLRHWHRKQSNYDAGSRLCSLECHAS